MPDLTRAVLLAYGLGVAIGLARTDASWPARVALALLWPLGPAAFIVVVTLLFFALPIAFPIVGSIVFAIGVAIMAALVIGGAMGRGLPKDERPRFSQPPLPHPHTSPP